MIEMIPLQDTAQTSQTYEIAVGVALVYIVLALGAAAIWFVKGS